MMGNNKTKGKESIEDKLDYTIKIFENSSLPIIIIDENNKKIIPNINAEKIFGFSKIEDVYNSELIPPLIKSDQIEYEGKNFKISRNREGNVYYITLTDITEIFEQTRTDHLTELPNKKSAEETLKKEIYNSIRGERVFSVAYVDVDEFKLVNDTYGHDTGDEVIKHVGKNLKKILRAGDTVSRIYGDEFLLIMPGTNKNGAITSLIKRLSDNFPPYVLDKDNKDNKINIEVSYGAVFDYSLWEKERISEKEIDEVVNTLMKFADEKMYEHKRSKNTKN